MEGRSFEEELDWVAVGSVVIVIERVKGKGGKGMRRLVIRTREKENSRKKGKRSQTSIAKRSLIKKRITFIKNSSTKRNIIKWCKWIGN